MTLARLNRLFAADGRCFDVAVDHGFFGVESFLTGIEDMEEAVATLTDAAPDAIQLSPGQAPLLQRRPGPKPALVLRTDVANVYGPEKPRHLFSELVADAVELGADVIKADPTDDLADYPRVLEAAAPRPLLVRGGSKATEEEILERTRQMIELGAAGIVYGRNVIQHPDPAGMTRRLMEIVHA